MLIDLWKKQFNKNKLLMKHDDPQIFYQSQWQFKDGPSTFYLLYRWVVTLYLFGTWLLSVIDPKNLDKSQVFRIKWLIYLTNWGYTICLFQSLFCTVSLTVWVIHLKRTKDNNNQHPRWISSTYKMYWICNTIATDIAFGITTLYWALIYDDATMDLDALNMFMHATNSIAMLIELCVVKHPTYFVHFYWTILFGITYCIFSVIYYAAGGTSRNEDPYIYTVLNWKEAGRTTGIVFGVLVFIIALHGFTCCVYFLRTSIYRKINRYHISTKKQKYNTQSGFDNDAMSDDPV